VRRRGAVRQVEVIHRLGDVQIGVGVEAVHELAAAMPQITLHFEIHIEPEAEILLAAQTPPEFFAHRIVAHVGDVSHHARHRQASSRRLLAVVIAFVPIEVGDRLPTRFVERDCCAVPRLATGIAHHTVRVSHRFRRLRAAHSTRR
jgi:hypothetical protein